MFRASTSLLCAALVCGAFLGGDAVCKASRGVDVCMTLDDSGSLQAQGFNQEKAFAQILYDNFDEGSTRIAIYLFGTTPRLLVPFDTSFDEGREILKTSIPRLGNEDLLAATEGCEAALQPLDKKRQKLIILMTDGGQSSDAPALLNASAVLKDRGVIFSTVGITPVSEFGGFDEDLLRGMSSEKKDGDDLFYSLTVDSLPFDIFDPEGADNEDDATVLSDDTKDDASELASEICESVDGTTVNEGLSNVAKACIGIGCVGAVACILAGIAFLRPEILGGGAGAPAGGKPPVGGGEVAGGQAPLAVESDSATTAAAAAAATAASAAAAGASAAAATAVRTLTHEPVPCFDSPQVSPHPDSTVFPDSASSDALGLEKTDNTSINKDDISNPNLPDLPPTHLSIAIDTSRLGCSADHVHGDNRSVYASVVNKLQNALGVLSLGQMQTSVVSFSGLSADVPSDMASAPVSDDPEIVRKCIASIGPPPGADTHRASPKAAILAVNYCIYLLRTTEVRFRARRRVLVLHAGGFSDAEFKEESRKLGWTTANCVVVSGVGRDFDRAAGVQLGCVAMSCEEIEKLGSTEVLNLLRSLLAARNPRTLSTRQ